WVSQGCWIDSVGSRTLQGAYNAGGTTSAQSCLAFCESGGYAYAGMEYGTECFCSNAVLAGTSVQDPADCNMACSGDTSQACGGMNRLSLYKSTSTSGPKVAPGSSGYGYLGCYTDSVGARTLTVGMPTEGGGDSLTVEVCLAACAAAKFPYAGVEYSGQCYCGSQLSNGGHAADDGEAQCNMRCNGDKTEFCGGPDRLNLYIASTSSSTTTTSATLSAVLLPIGWTARGCYLDDPAARTLQTFMSVPGGPDAMTVEACVAGCASNGFTVAGLEYGQECWCDTKYETLAQPLSNPETNCFMPCKGNSAETCGGPDRM
ncbi:WSC-domain-containing protein, partial [Mytilinidion resinicola]